jgi:gliding motility-associated transport system ATP-binding protein
MIEVTNLTKRFGLTVAVDDVSFSVKRGQIVGLLGPNGAGKTTTMRILTGFLMANSGVVNVGDYDVAVDPVKVRGMIGYLPENAPLYSDMRVQDYLRFIAEARGISGKKFPASFERVVRWCGLREVLKHNIGELSKGYNQRVGLAQAMIHDPDILILDEPTSGLDPNQIVEIRNLIRTIGSEKTVILSTHILQEVSAVCKRVMIIDRGKIVADAATDELHDLAGGTETTLVQIKGARSDVEGRLLQLKGVKEVTTTMPDDEEDYTLFHLHTDAKHDVTEEVFNLVVDNGWKLKELSRKRATLEDVFRKLTQGEPTQ